MGQTSILDGIRIASPCPASWETMAGDDRTRFCSECGKDVYNISAMTTAEASALIAEREGRLCVKLYRRADGTVLTADCPVGAGSVRRSRLRKLAGLGVVGLAVASSGVAALGFFGSRPSEPFPSSPGVTMDDWIDWALIKVGWRKPRPIVTLGRIDVFSLSPYQGPPLPDPYDPDTVEAPECVETPEP